MKLYKMIGSVTLNSLETLFSHFTNHNYTTSDNHPLFLRVCTDLPPVFALTEISANLAAWGRDTFSVTDGRSEMVAAVI